MLYFVLEQLNSRPLDVEYVRLFHDIYSENINGNLYRGYTILPAHGAAKYPIKDIQFYPETKRPVWFIFAGMGSQWPGMGETLETFILIIRRTVLNSVKI
jgi:fatty acid synthase